VSNTIDSVPDAASPKTLRTALIAAAVASVALFAAGSASLGSPPTVDDSPRAVVAWFHEHGDAARFYAWTATLGALSFAVAAAIIAGPLPRPYREMFMLGAAGLIVENAVAAWFWAGLALHPRSLEPSSARLVLDLSTLWGPVLNAATTTMIGAVTALGIGRRPMIPRWLTVLGAIAFAEQFLETITVLGTHGFAGPGGGMNLVLGPTLVIAWLVGAVVWAARWVSSPETSP
jgi:hypothetical protein